MKSNQYYSSAAMLKVLSSVLVEPEYLDDGSEFVLTKEDFVNEFHYVLYAAAFSLYNNGCHNISLAEIEDYLNNKPKSKAIFEKCGGPKVVKDLVHNADPSNFDYNFQMVKKYTLLRKYAEAGMDVSFIYDPNEINDIKAKEEQDRALGEMSLDDLADLVEDKIVNVRQRVVDGYNDNSCQVGEGLSELVERLQQEPIEGPPLYDPIFSKVAMGARLGTFYLKSASTGTGKAIPNDTIIPTPEGPRKVSEIMVGDPLFTYDGKPTKVIGVFPQASEKEIWEVCFEDGRKAECCADHLWEYRLGDSWYVAPTKDIEALLKIGACYVPLNGAVEYSTSVHWEIDPYLLGIALGANDSQREIPESLRRVLEEIHECSIKRVEGCVVIDGEIMNYTSIPPEYMYDSLENRLKFLRGLIDIIGIQDQPFQTRLPVSNCVLANQIANMFRSIGYYTAYERGEVVVDLSRTEVKIISITRTKKKVPMTCFAVEDPSHLFLMNDYIVTHNTRSMMADACNFACDEIYEDGKWIDNGTKQNTLFISVELDYEELQTMALAFITKVPENKIIGREEMTALELERIKRGCDILERSNLHLVYLPNYSLKDIRNCLKRYIRKEKVQFVILDYIATSMSIIEEVARASSGMKIREDQILHMLATELKQIAVDYNVFVMSATQLSGAAKHEKILDQNVLAGAKAIANRVDLGSIMMDCDSEDIELISPICSSLGVLPNVKMSIYKNRRGEHTRIILWMNADKGICSYKTLFATDYNYNLVKVGGE